MKRRRVLFQLAAALLAAVCAAAFSPAREARAQAAQDSAAVLSETAERDLAELSSRLDKAAGVGLALVTKHFLGGAEAFEQAQKLLSQREGADGTLLVLMVIGEEKYAWAAGSAVQALLDAETVQTLLSRHFRGPYRDRDYDRAVGAFFSAAAAEIGNANGTPVETGGLFGVAAVTPSPAPTAAPSAGTLKIFDPDWLNEFLVKPGAGQTAARDGESGSEGSEEETGMSIGSVIVLGLVLYFLFGRKGRRAVGSGCGCGPLGWIFGAFGLTKLFRLRK